MNRIKTFIWVVAIFLSLILVACKKSQDHPMGTPSPSYIKFKIDDLQTECTSLIKASYLPLFPDSQISISGHWNGGDFELHISGGNQPLAIGTYAFDVNKWHYGTIWTTSPADKFIAGFDFFGFYKGSGKVIISEIGSQYVKGTFDFVTGTGSSNPSLPPKTVTAGEFYVKRG